MAKYNVVFSNVDGAGYLREEQPDWSRPVWDLHPIREFTKEEAERVAAEEQDESEQDGNPWNYRYKVVPA